MDLSGKQRQKLQNALIHAFPDKASLERMLSHELDRNLDEIAGGSNLQDIVFNLIKQSKAENWIEDLIEAALLSKPRNTSLRAIAEELLPNLETPPAPPPNIPTGQSNQQPPEPTTFSRKNFLYLALGGVGFVTAVVYGNSVNQPSPTEEPTSPPESELPPNSPSPPPSPPVQQKDFQEDLGNGVTLEMVSIRAGSFKMGSPAKEKGRQINEGPQKDVDVPAFFMGKFEVTQEQYQAIMGQNTSYFKGEKRPVESVSWNDAVEFCEKLSQKTRRTYGLPSEAQWEYACRAGTTTPFHFGETITKEQVNHNRSYGGTTEVGKFPPNDFGLHDMHGNVCEWCEDTYHDNYNGVPTDGSARTDNNKIDNKNCENKTQRRVLRGGAWTYPPENCRSAFRTTICQDKADAGNGFRVVCNVAERNIK